MTDEQINTTALREHAGKGWGDDCLLPKAVVKRVAYELDSLRALQSASKSAARLLGDGATTPWRVMNHPQAGGGLAFHRPFVLQREDVGCTAFYAPDGRLKRWKLETEAQRTANRLNVALAASPAAPAQSEELLTDNEDEDIQPTPESERAAFNGMIRWHLIRLLQAWRYGGDLRSAGMAAFEWARTNDVGQVAFAASERAVKLSATPAQSGDNEYVNSLTERLAAYAEDKRNTAFARSTMSEVLNGLRSGRLVAPQPSQPVEAGEQEAK